MKCIAVVWKNGESKEFFLESTNTALLVDGEKKLRLRQGRVDGALSQERELREVQALVSGNIAREVDDNGVATGRFGTLIIGHGAKVVHLRDNAECVFRGGPESEIHKMGKRFFENVAAHNGIKASVEAVCANVERRSDVRLHDGDLTANIEIQNSPLDLLVFKERCRDLDQEGVPYLWVLTADRLFHERARGAEMQDAAFVGREWVRAGKDDDGEDRKRCTTVLSGYSLWDMVLEGDHDEINPTWVFVQNIKPKSGAGSAAVDPLTGERGALWLLHRCRSGKTAQGYRKTQSGKAKKLRRRDFTSSQFNLWADGPFFAADLKVEWRHGRVQLVPSFLSLPDIADLARNADSIWLECEALRRGAEARQRYTELTRRTLDADTVLTRHVIEEAIQKASSFLEAVRKRPETERDLDAGPARVRTMREERHAARAHARAARRCVRIPLLGKLRFGLAAYRERVGAARDRTRDIVRETERLDALRKASAANDAELIHAARYFGLEFGTRSTVEFVAKAEQGLPQVLRLLDTVTRSKVYDALSEAFREEPLVRRSCKARIAALTGDAGRIASDLEGMIAELREVVRGATLTHEVFRSERGRASMLDVSRPRRPETE